MEAVESLQLFIIGLKYSGVQGDVKPSFLYKIYREIMVWGCLLPFLILEGVTFIKTLSGEVKYSDSSYYVITHYFASLKIILHYFNSNDTVYIPDMIVDPIFNTFNGNHNEYMHKSIKFMSRVTRLWTYIAVGTFLTTLGTAFLKNIFSYGMSASLWNSVPIELWCPWDYKNNIKIYPIFLIYESIFMFYIALVVSLTDGMITAVMYIASIQLEILSRELRLLGDNNESCQDVETHIKKCVNHHLVIVDFVEKSNSYFNSVIVAQCVATAVIICFLGLQLSRSGIVDASVLHTIYLLFAVVIQLFYYCHFGNEVYYRTTTLIDSVYHSHWYNRKCKCPNRLSLTKSMLMIMERMKRPFSIKAAKVFSLNYATFMSILRSGYSYYAILNSVQNKVSYGN